jgi:lycopene beta-cyclase
MALPQTSIRGQEYDYIIAGAGCAGLSLAVRLVQSGNFTDKKILLIDREDKKTNDRTWCFWEQQPGLFEPIVYKKWNKVWFHAEGFSRLLEIQPYEYKLIRGIDFYQHCMAMIQAQPNIEIVQADITAIKSENGKSWIEAAGQKIFASFIFSSIIFEKLALNDSQYMLLQHFKGWIIETESPVFKPDEATLMDFRIGQQQGTAFVYVMPFTEKRALVEYTLFTKDLLTPSQYEEGLRQYISQYLQIEKYSISEEEYGIIPMTNYKYPLVVGGIVYLGTAGGQTKASSGYTFNFIQKHTSRIVENIIKRDNPFVALPAGPSRFRFYDSTLLHLLYHNKLPGDKIFQQLFKKNKPQQVLRFLDNETNLWDEMKIFSTLPILPFSKAAIKQL